MLPVENRLFQMPENAETNTEELMMAIGGFIEKHTRKGFLHPQKVIARADVDY